MALPGAYTPAGVVLQVVRASESPHPVNYYLRDRIAVSPVSSFLSVDCFIFNGHFVELCHIFFPKYCLVLSSPFSFLRGVSVSIK
jgi:hypothetical protein